MGYGACSKCTPRGRFLGRDHPALRYNIFLPIWQNTSHFSQRPKVLYFVITGEGMESLYKINWLGTLKWFFRVQSWVLGERVTHTPPRSIQNKIFSSAEMFTNHKSWCVWINAYISYTNMCFMYKTFTHDRIKNHGQRGEQFYFVYYQCCYLFCVLHTLEPIENAQMLRNNAPCNYDRIKVYFIIVFYILFSKAFNLGLGGCNFEQSIIFL